MNMKTTVTITKFSDDFGDLKNMKPAGFGTTQVPEGELPFDNGVPMQDPETQKDRDLWQRKFLMLHDVPMPKVDDWGKAIMLVVDPSGQYNVKFDYPTQLQNPRNFSITGDGTAPAVAFNGLNDVVLNLTNLVANKWKTARTVTVTGADASGNFTLDGSADVNFPVTVVQAPKWTTARTITLTGNASGTTSIDGTANVSINVTNSFATNSTNATNATNAVNAQNANTATTATTATKVAPGGLTVTLTGGVTGSASSDAAGNVTIATTASGGGNPGGDTPDGKFISGSMQQMWGRQETSTDASPTLRGYVTINFDPPFVSADAYTYKAEVELEQLDSIVPYHIRNYTKTASQLVLRLMSADDTEGLASFPLSYFIVGNIS